jgi:hypothetical protein
MGLQRALLHTCGIGLLVLFRKIMRGLGRLPRRRILSGGAIRRDARTLTPELARLSDERREQQLRGGATACIRRKSALGMGQLALLREWGAGLPHRTLAERASRVEGRTRRSRMRQRRKPPPSPRNRSVPSHFQPPIY